MPTPTPPVITWDSFKNQVIHLAETPEVRQELEEYCDSNVFSSLREHLNAYHALTDPEQMGEKGFQLLTLIHSDLELEETVSLEFIEDLFDSSLFLTVIIREKTVVRQNILSLGIQDTELEDVFHLVNITHNFTLYDVGNIEAWLIAQSRKPNPSAVNFWIDRDNLLVHDLYIEIYNAAVRLTMQKWESLYPERMPVINRLHDLEIQFQQLNAQYLQNPTYELLLQIQNISQELIQIQGQANTFLEEFKKLIPTEGIPLQDKAYRFIRNYPRDDWDNKRIQFMREQLNIPEVLSQSCIRKLDLLHNILNTMQDELPRKYPHFTFNEVPEAFGVHADLARFYDQELLLRMDYRSAYNIFCLLLLKWQGGNILETGVIPEFNTGVNSIIQLHTEREVIIPGQAVPLTEDICTDRQLVLGAIKERVLEQMILKSPNPPDTCYRDAPQEDQPKIDAIWTAIKEFPLESLFKTIERNPIFKDYVKLTSDVFLPEENSISRQMISSRADSAGLQAVINNISKYRTQIEKFLPHLSRNITLADLRTFRDETFNVTYYNDLNTDARDAVNMIIEAQCFYRFNRFLEHNNHNNDILSGPTAIGMAVSDFFTKKYNSSLTSFLQSIEDKTVFPNLATYFVNHQPKDTIQTVIDLQNDTLNSTLQTTAESVLFRRIQRVLKFQEYFHTKAIYFYELANNLEAQTIQFIPQDLLLSSFEYPEGLCLGLSMLQGIADDLNSTDIFASDIAAVSALQLNRLDNTLSESDEQRYNQFSETLRTLNRSVNANFFNTETTIFKKVGTSSVAQLADIIAKLPFQGGNRFLLVTPNHGMTLSFKGDSYTFYDSNIGYTSFDSPQKAGTFIQKHLDLVTGLGDYYGLTTNDIYITRYQNTDLTVFKELNYFTDTLKQGGVSLTIDKLQELDQKKGTVKFGEISFKRTELVAMGGKYNLNPMDEKTPFEAPDFWDNVSFSAQKIYQFMYDHEIDTLTIDRLKILKAAGKLPTDGGVLLSSDLTDGKGTEHVEPLHYSMLKSAEQIADNFDRLSTKFDNVLDNLGINIDDYRLKNSEVEKLENHLYKITLAHKETGEEVPLTIDCAEFEGVVGNHINTLVEATEPAVVLGGAGLGLMGLIRGAIALRGGYGSSHDIASVVLGGKQLADAILGTMAMAVIEDSLAQSGTIFTFSIEGTLANLCEQTALEIGGLIGKLLSAISIFLKLPLIGLNIWGLYEDVNNLNASKSGPERAVAISQLVIDCIVVTLTLASFAVPEIAVPILIISALGIGIDAIVQNVATAHERYYQFIKWQDNMRSLANIKLNKPVPRVIDFSRNQILGDVKLILTDDEKNPYQLTYAKSCDTAIRYGHHPDMSPEQVKNAVGYGYSVTAPIPPFAREEFFSPANLPFSIGSGIIQLVIMGFGTRFQLMSQVEYISDWLLYDDRNQRASGGYWETFYTASGFNSIQEDGTSFQITGNSEDNIFMVPNIVDWTDIAKATETIQKYATYQFTITTGPGNNMITLGQTGTYKLIGGTGNNTLDLSHIELDIKVDLDITDYQNIYNDHPGGKYENCIKASISNFNIVKCPAFMNYNVKRSALIKGASNKPNVFVLGRSTFVEVLGKGGGNTYIVSQIGKRALGYDQEINLYVQPPVSANSNATMVSVERIHFEDYKLLDFSNYSITLNTTLTPVLTLSGFIMQTIMIYGFVLKNNVVTNVLFSTADGFSFYYDNNLKKGVVTQVDFDKWNQYNQEMFKQTFDFHFFDTIYKEKFVLADDVVCINKAGTLFMKQSSKKGVLFANLKTETITIPKEFQEFSWTVATNHSIHTIVIQSFMCNPEKPLIVFDGHSLTNIKNTIDLSDFGSSYTLVASKQRNALLLTLTNTNPQEQLTIFFKDIFNQDITQAIANSDIVLRRNDKNVLKISALLELCKDYINETLTIPFAE